MGILDRFRGRSNAPVAESRFSINEIAQLFSSGQRYTDVDLSNAESALQDTAYHAGVNLVASLASELPINIWRGEGTSRQKTQVPGYLEDPAGDGYGREDWVYKLVTSWLTRGNTNADVLERRDGYITQADIFHPDLPQARIDPDSGRIEWYVQGQPVPNMWHSRVYPFPGYIKGLSPIELHRTQIGLSITTTRFGKQWFDEGAVPATVLHNEERNITRDQAQSVKDRFVAAMRGSREPLVLDRGWKLDQVQINPDESQFLQTQQFSRAECARIIGPGVAELLGYETGGNLTYSNRLDRIADFSTLTMDFWLRRTERVFKQMLPKNLTPEIDRDALLDTLKKDRYQTYSQALGGVPWMKPSEVRPDEGLPPAPELDVVAQPSAPADAEAGRSTMARIARGLRDGELTEDEAYVLLRVMTEKGGADVPGIE
jgi:HK97 family phage portal protein